MSEFGDGYSEVDEFDEMMFNPDADPRGKRLAADKRANREPTFDYYEAFPPNQPKFEIGQYVAESGFDVPLINTLADWQQAFDDETAMLRSEMPQDYSGLSGLFSSERLSDSLLVRHTQGLHREIGNLVMRGLRDGLLDPTEYMTNLRTDLNGVHFTWEREELDNMDTAARFSALNLLDIHRLSASHWRYIEGTNVSVFADPNVEGRYHFGVKPRNSYVVGHKVDKGDYDKPHPHRLVNKGPFFVARPFIEYYEQIRNLSRFDASQCPVIEMQQGLDGNIHFLQYLKTGQKQRLTDPFDLPSSSDIFRATDVRGVTDESGRFMRMYIAPGHLEPSMQNQAMYCAELRDGKLRVQIATKIASFILYDAWLSFKDNHNDASPLYRPELAASIYSEASNSPRLVDIMEQTLGVSRSSRQYQGRVPYVEIKVTSNGREAAIESDWIAR